MKRIFIILAGVLALWVGVSRLVPKPEVVDMDKAVENRPANPVQASSYETPQRWAETSEYFDGRLKLNVDASILAPQSQTWPTYSVKLAGYSQAEVDAIVKALVGDSGLYDQSGLNTKSALEQQLQALQLELQQREDGAYTGNDDNSIENLRGGIETLQQLIPQAPENGDKQEITAQLTYDEILGADHLFASVGSDRMDGAWIDIRSGHTLPSSESSITYYAGPTTFDAVEGLEEAVGVDMTEEEAIQRGDALLEQMGIEGYQCTAVKAGVESLPEENRTPEAIANAEKSWLLYYTKSYHGIPSTFENQQGAFQLKEKGIDGLPTFYDRIEIAINDQGVRSFIWYGREKEDGVIAENMALVPFEKIEQILLDGIELKYASAAGNEGSEALDCTITRIELGYMRVMDVGLGTYRAIPVWDFFGTVQPQGAVSTPPNGAPDDNSLLTISAIDGSLIDRGVGY